MPHVAIWMDLEIIILSEVNPESKKKKDTNEFYLQNRNRLRTWKTNVSSPKKKGRGKDKLGVWN